jgi:hypothetical protein
MDIKYISKILGVLGIYMERKNLSMSMGHVEMILRRLDYICMGLVAFTSVFVWLMFFNVNVLNVFVCNLRVH